MPSITCPRCGMTSYNPNDIREGYCGSCHDFTGEPTERIEGPVTVKAGDLYWACRIAGRCLRWTINGREHPCICSYIPEPERAHDS